MGLARELAVAESYCAELLGDPEAGDLVEEWADGVVPAGELWEATKKLRRTVRNERPQEPAGVHAELVPAGHVATSQVYRCVWLSSSSPLTDQEENAVRRATAALERIYS